MARVGIKKPAMLEVKSSSGATYMGGSQMWYRQTWNRQSGCGPTTASGLVWYLARARSEFSFLCSAGHGGRTDFEELMNIMFGFITPTTRGVNTTAIFTEGLECYSRFRGLPLVTRTLEIPPAICSRPSKQELSDFLVAAFEADLPVAFLNLSNGTLKNLDNWHWVLLISLDTDTMMATMCDQGRTKEIALGEWLKSTVLGGGFVTADMA